MEYFCFPDILGHSMKFGKAFSDSISVTVPSMFRKSRDIGSSWWLGTGRILVFSTILCIAVFVLIFRLVDLSLIRGHEFRMLADDNRTRELIRHAPRGILRDRTGKPLVENIPEYRLIEPCEVNPAQSCTVRISQSEGENLIKNGLSAGKFLEIDYVRQYRISEPIAHVIGYTGELSEKELKDEYYSLRKYKIGDRVGRYGAESVYEEKLRGRDGKEAGRDRRFRAYYPYSWSGYRASRTGCVSFSRCRTFCRRT